MLSISCPHCGTTRSTPREKLPRKKARARCPSCRNTFLFDPSMQADDNPTQAEPGQNIACPQCGLEREIPNDRKTSTLATLNCRRCQHKFRLNEGQQADQANALNRHHLTSIGTLFTNTWELFCHRGWGLLAIYSIGFLLILSPVLAGVYLLPGVLATQHLLAWIVLLTGILYTSLGFSWISACMFDHMIHTTHSVRDSLSQGRKDLFKFALLLLLIFFLFCGGSLLLLAPGIIFLIWFSVSQYVLADEAKGVFHALRKSRQLTQGHWWQVFSRFCLLLLAGLALSTLAERLPVIGMPIGLIISILLVPFSLLYYSLIYKDLKQLQKTAPTSRPKSSRIPLAVALLGWLLIPALVLFEIQPRQQVTAQLQDPALLFSLLLTQDQDITELTAGEQPPPQPQPERLSAQEYELLLTSKHLPSASDAVNLGPARLSAKQFWSDTLAPHLWLKLELAALPNLTLSPRRAARIQIDQVLDRAARDRYDRSHSFENSAFQWVDIYPREPKQGYAGIRNIYLTEGTSIEQLQTISGKLQLILPLAIETVELKRQDIGKTIAIAGTKVQLEGIEQGRIVLHYQGDPLQFLNVQAFDLQEQPLQQTGTVWNLNGETAVLKQMFAGEVEVLKLLVAADSVSRSYPFELNL